MPVVFTKQSYKYFENHVYTGKYKKNLKITYEKDLTHKMSYEEEEVLAEWMKPKIGYEDKGNEDKIKKEESIMKKALELKSDGNKEFKQKHYRSAIDIYVEVIQLCQPIASYDKKDFYKCDFTELLAKIYSNLAKSYLALQRTALSIQNFEESLKYKKTLQVYFNLSLVFKSIKRFDKIVQLLTEALKIGDGDNKELKVIIEKELKMS